MIQHKVRKWNLRGNIVNLIIQKAVRLRLFPHVSAIKPLLFYSRVQKL